MKESNYILSILFLFSMSLISMENDDFSLNKEYLVKRIKDKIIQGFVDLEEEIDWEEELPHHLLLAQDLYKTEDEEDIVRQCPEKVQQIWTNLCKKWDLPEVNIKNIRNNKK